MDIFGDVGHRDDSRPPGRFFNPLANFAKGGVWEQVCVGGRVGATELDRSEPSLPAKY